MYNTTLNEEINEVHLWCFDRSSNQALIRLKDFTVDLTIYPKGDLEKLSDLAQAISILAEDVQFSYKIMRRLSDNVDVQVLICKTKSIASHFIIRNVTNAKTEYGVISMGVSSQIFGSRNVKLNQWFTLDVHPAEETISTFENEFIGDLNSLTGIDLEETVQWSVKPPTMAVSFDNATGDVSAVFLKDDILTKYQISRNREKEHGVDVHVFSRFKQLDELSKLIWDLNPALIIEFGIPKSEMYKNKSLNILSPIKGGKIGCSCGANHTLRVPGRLFFDIKMLMTENYKQSDLSETFPGVDGCVKMLDLFTSKNFYETFIQRSAITNTSINFNSKVSILDRCVEVFNSFAVERGYIPNLTKRPKFISLNSFHVRDPTPGIHRDVAKYDILRFYPSIIQNFNICPTTLATGEDSDIDCHSITIEGKTTRFVKQYVRVGLFPQLISDLIAERDRLKNSSDELRIMKCVEIKKMFTCISEVLNMTRIPTGCVSVFASQMMEDLKTYFVNNHSATAVWNNVDELMVKIDDFESKTEQINDDLARLFPISIELVDVIDVVVFDKIRFHGVTKDGRFFSRGLIKKNKPKFINELYEKLVKIVLTDDNYSVGGLFQQLFIDYMRLERGLVPKEDLACLGTFGNYKNEVFYMGVFKKELIKRGLSPKTGDKVKYCVVKCDEKALGYRMRSLDLDFNEPIDISYYLKRMKLIDQLFELATERFDVGSIKIGRRTIPFNKPCAAFDQVSDEQFDELINAYSELE